MKIVNSIPEPLAGKVPECDHQTEIELPAVKLTCPSAREGRDCVENSISEEPWHVAVEGSEARGWEGQMTDWEVATATSTSGYLGYCASNLKPYMDFITPGQQQRKLEQLASAPII